MTNPATFTGEPTIEVMSGQPFQVWSGYGISVPILFYNRDITNAVYLAYQNNVAVGATNAVILNPQSSVTMDGGRTIYAVGVKNAGPLQIVPGGTNYSAIASPITALAQAGSFSGVTAALLPAGGATTYTPLSLVNITSYSSYDLNTYVFATSPGSVGAPIVANVQLQWFDDLVSGIPVFEEDWWVWLGRAAPSAGVNSLCGCGPMHGQYMTVNVTIPTTSLFGATVQYFNLFGSSRVLPYSDWRQNAQTLAPQSNGLTFQAGAGVAFDNVLANVSGVTLGASALIWIPCGMYSGPAYYRYEGNATPLHNIVLANAEGLVSGALVAGTGNNGILLNIAGTGSAEFEGELFLPRAPCALVAQAPVGGMGFSFQLVAQQAA